jgi:hypothetical protein
MRADRGSGATARSTATTIVRNPCLAGARNLIRAW